MSILDEINQRTQATVNARLGHITPERLEKTSSDLRVPLDFRAALQKPGLSLIAEVKKASPSKGIIRPDFHPLRFAQSYAQHGADCISVLTEEHYFQGHPDYLREIRQSVNLPLLRKDFMVDLRQVREAYEMGADAILLIVASLEDGLMKDLYHLAQSFGLTALVEVHDHAELERAIRLGANLIGVNNRNLKTFATDLATSVELARLMPAGITKVSESGIQNRADCERLAEHGFDAILVGETLMRAPDPGSLIAELLPHKA